MLDRSVLVLIALAVAGSALLWRLISWNVEATSAEGVVVDTSQDQRILALMFILPYLLGPAAAAVLVGALIGLPLVVGARYAAIVRARRPEPPTSRRGS
jgi:uncharacterized paraquat-inducible protein A